MRLYIDGGLGLSTKSITKHVPIIIIGIVVLLEVGPRIDPAVGVIMFNAVVITKGQVNMEVIFIYCCDKISCR